MTIRNRLGLHARAARASCTPPTASARGSRYRPRDDHGRQVDPGHPAGRLAGQRLQVGADGDDEQAAVEALAAESTAASERREVSGHRRLAGHRGRAGLVVEREEVPVVAAARPPDAVAAEVDRLPRAVEASRGQLQAIKDRLAREAVAPRLHLRRAPADARGPPAAGPSGGGDPRGARQRRVGAAHGGRAAAPACSTSSRTPTCARAATSTTCSARADQPRRRARRALARRLPGQLRGGGQDLTPSDLAELDWERVLAVATDAGSATHHTSILARSFGVPAVVGLKDATRASRPARWWWWTARGQVVVEPSAPMLEGLRAVQERDRVEEAARLQEMRALPAVTRDGVRVGCTRTWSSRTRPRPRGATERRGSGSSATPGVTPRMPWR